MDTNTRRVVVLVLRVLAMAMAAGSLAVALLGTNESDLLGIVLGIGLFALSVAAIIEPRFEQG